ncbi:MAG: hypothetical protein QN131_00435 [Armatimonadota bacterium]|nr:hypothetical protein [Armatimonadota bacterium]MDR7548392.1 hypothetical protein [Armatimonadota bacterium]
MGSPPRSGLIGSPRAPDGEVGRAHAQLVAANPGSRLDQVNRLLTRLGSGHELDEAIGAVAPGCHRCALTVWCWYDREIRREGRWQAT